MRRWVRYEAPIMVCVDVDEHAQDGRIVGVVLGDEHDDIALARDNRGHLLVYDDAMNRLDTEGPAETKAIAVAEYRGEWPARIAWEEGPDALRYPGLYEPIPDANDDELDLRCIDEHDPAAR
jgi:hypothetical protein